jgi:transposase
MRAKPQEKQVGRQGAKISGLRPVPDPEVVARRKRRQFTAEYKLRILQEAEACQGPEMGALLRREGLYASHLSKWRQARQQGDLKALSQPRGRKPDPDAGLKQQVHQLEREKARLQRKLRQAEAIIEIQKKSPRSWASAWRLRTTSRAETLGRGARSHRRAPGRLPSTGCGTSHDLRPPPPCLYRWPPRHRPVSHRALRPEERQQVLDLLHSPRFADASPSQVYATVRPRGKHRPTVRRQLAQLPRFAP